MREILFCGKRKTNGEWIYGDYFRSKIFNTEFGTRVVHSITYYHNNIEHTYCVDPETVGQYTGLTDKNGKRIFEGDVVKQFPRASWGDFSRVEIGKVFWEENTLRWKRTGKDINGEKFMTFCMAKDCVYEVIGNIHDNPELLEVGE